MSGSQRPRGRPKSFHDRQTQNTIQSLDRAIEVLEYLAQHGSRTLTGIATSMNQSPATIYRVLSTFEARGLVETSATSQAWSIGPAAFRIGSAFLRRTGVLERARPAMRDLMEATGETANLGIQSGPNVMFISQVETHHSIRAFFPPGTISPMHASGIGKALLSAMPEPRIRQIIGDGPLEKFTAKTLSSTEALLADLSLSHRRGFALDDEEKTEGMRCIAAPVRDLHGETVAGISVSGPVNRINSASIESIGGLVRSAANNVSIALGAAREDGPVQMASDPEREGA